MSENPSSQTAKRLYKPLNKQVEWRDFGCQPYEVIEAKQLEAVAQVRAEPNRCIILMGEHWPVYTAGRAARTTLPASHYHGIPVKTVSRGGQLTYHGPGQLVIYPVVQVPRPGGIPLLIGLLEQWLHQLLSACGITTLQPSPCGTAERPATGVWIPPLEADEVSLKIASIGLAVKHWISYHGLALNVCNDLTPFHWITPCGYSGTIMASVEAVQWKQGQTASPTGFAQLKDMVRCYQPFG